jgi:hypothetical protein
MDGGQHGFEDNRPNSRLFDRIGVRATMPSHTGLAKHSIAEVVRADRRREVDERAGAYRGRPGRVGKLSLDRPTAGQLVRRDQ